MLSLTIVCWNLKAQNERKKLRLFSVRYWYLSLTGCFCLKLLIIFSPVLVFRDWKALKRSSVMARGFLNTIQLTASSQFPVMTVFYKLWSREQISTWTEINIIITASTHAIIFWSWIWPCIIDKYLVRVFEVAETCGKMKNSYCWFHRVHGIKNSRLNLMIILLETVFKIMLSI